MVGLIAPPQLARASREEITWVVNGRPVRDTALTQTLLDAYRPMLARDQHPVAVIWIDAPPQEVDVNVHPAKAWVRFRAPRLVQETLFVAVQEALRAGGGGAAPGRHGAGRSRPPAAARRSPRPRRGCRRRPPSRGSSRRRAAPWNGERFGAVVGQLQDTFIVAATDEEVFFVDQHVAHERVLFERLEAELQAGPLASQELLFPETVELPPGQQGLLAEWRGRARAPGLRARGLRGRHEPGARGAGPPRAPGAAAPDHPHAGGAGQPRQGRPSAAPRPRARVRGLPRRHQGARPARARGDAPAPRRPRPPRARPSSARTAAPSSRASRCARSARSSADMVARTGGADPLLVIVGPTGRGQDRRGGASGRPPAARSRQRRLAPGVSRHGHRHRQARPRRSARR